VDNHSTLNVLALIPAFNEGKRISPVIAGALVHLPVLVVDDGSIDNTCQVAADNGAVVLCQSSNQGKGVALRAGFQRAIETGYQAVVTLDADGQHDPADIPVFLDLFRLNATDLIIGQRDFSQIPPIRRLANTLGRWSFSWAIGKPMPDNQSGFRLISHRMMKAMMGSTELGFSFEVEMIVVCIRSGYTLDWVPIHTIYTGEGSHINPFKHVIEFTRMLAQTKRRMAQE
jgi:glycosyltransferase involved in cell wall biosynthesis